MKTYIGDTQINKSFLGDNQINSKNIGITTIPIDPSTISGLLIWLDPAKNTISANASDEVVSITNAGSAFSTWDFYPDTDTSSPATKANFIQGTGDTRYYDFSGANNHMITLFQDGLTFTPKTIISIAKNKSSSNEAGIWNISQVTGTTGGISHPACIGEWDINMSIGGLCNDAGTGTAIPSLGTYVTDETDYVFFAAKAENFYVDGSAKIQSRIGGETSTTYEHYSEYDTTTYNVNPGGNQQGASNTNAQHVAHIVYDSVLTEAQINGIYQYYINRGYPLKFAPIT